MLNNVISIICKKILICRHRGVKFGKDVFILGIPRVVTVRSSQIIISDKVTINSISNGYHLNMHSKVKLMADRPNALILIGSNSRIHGACIHAYERIEIGSNCLIAANCQIFDGNGHDLSFPEVANRINTIGGAKAIHIEDNVWLGANVIVMPGVTIGYGSVISAGSVVCDDIPPMSIARGNPAVVIKTYTEQV